MRLLAWLLESGMLEDERTARGLIMRGDVLVNDRPVTSPSAAVPPQASVRIRAASVEHVLKGSLKLRPAVERSGFDVGGQVCLDLGASSGGFTKVLLELGASLVYAVDVGYGLVVAELRADPRVVLLERTNARTLTASQVPQPVARVVGDLSFISWSAVMPAITPLLAPDAQLLLLVKPQFELAAMGLGRSLVHGVARDASLVQACLERLYNTWQACGLRVRMLFKSSVRGAKGNQEYFVHLVRQQPATSLSEYESLVAQALREAMP